MPYIKEKNRLNLNSTINSMVDKILSTNNRLESSNIEHIDLTNEELLNIAGDINYVFSSILIKVMGDISYPKIAIITGVLENIKQEFYRRAATPYENKKIFENGDLREYKLLN